MIGSAGWRRIEVEMDIVLRNLHRPAFRCFALCAALYLLVPFRPTAAGAPASLKEAYGERFDVGVAVPSGRLSDAEQGILVANVTAVTPENSMKADAIHPEEDRYDFREADEAVKLAQGSKLKVNGHTLVWHSQCPDWFSPMPGNQPQATWC